MANKTQTEETRYMELSIPQEIMADTAQIIQDNEINAAILGRVDEENCIVVGLDYSPEQRKSVMEILELIEDYNNDDEAEEGEETED
jgi:hypothetical protein